MCLQTLTNINMRSKNAYPEFTTNPKSGITTVKLIMWIFLFEKHFQFQSQSADRDIEIKVLEKDLNFDPIDVMVLTRTEK